MIETVTKICRIITDDKIGNINPALALAEAITSELSLKIQHITIKNNRFLRLLPVSVIKFFSRYYLIKFFFNIAYDANVVVTIGNGGASIVPCLALASAERRTKGTGLFVQLQNPRIDSHSFDYVIAPIHDDVRNDNVIPIIGSLSRVTHILKTTEFKMPMAFLKLQKPLIGVFIGGRNSRYQFSNDDATELAEYLLNYSHDNAVSLVITCSRRTGKDNEMILRSVLKGKHIYFPDETDDNPYFMMLQHCDASIITCDSVNMISDSVTAGLPTFLYELSGDNGKFLHFYNALKRRKLLFSASKTYKPIKIGVFDETQRVSKIIMTALIKRYKHDGIISKN